MSLREEATNFIYKHGYPVVHLKLADTRSCGCVGESEEPDPGCKLCKGLGLVYHRHIIKTMNRFTFDEQQRPFWGEMTESDRLFYFTYDTDPSVRDLIWLPKLTVNSKIVRPLEYIEKYQITAVRRFVGPDGLLCYFAIKASAGNAG